jgi:HAD superfamily hydrolase (TIGR01490 family)
MKKLAVFDIDGTIFRSSLLIEITEALIHDDIFPLTARKIYAESYKNWLDRSDSYEKYIGDVIKSFEKNIKGVKSSEFIPVAKKVVAFHQNRVYRHTRDLVAKLHKDGYYLLAISKSPFEMVDEFCRGLGFNKVYGLVYEIGVNKKYTGNVLYKELLKDKATILKRAISKEGLTLKGSIGVGDSESDIAMLKLVEHPVCFNPNSKLFKHAKRAGWSVVVERKDVIYHL